MDPRFRGDERSEELLSEQISFYLACFARSARGRALVELNGKAGGGSLRSSPILRSSPRKRGSIGPDRQSAGGFWLLGCCFSLRSFQRRLESR